MFQQVKEFQTVFGQLISDSPKLPDDNIRMMRQKILKEEVEEFSEAYKVNDQVEMADAICDILYVIAGTCVSYGICPDTSIDPFERIKKTKQSTMFYNIELDKILSDTFSYYEMAELDNDLAKISCYLNTLISDAISIAIHFGYPLQELFDEVHRSNMSKTDENGKAIKREDGKILKSSRWSPPDIETILVRHGII